MRTIHVCKKGSVNFDPLCEKPLSGDLIVCLSHDGQWFHKKPTCSTCILLHLNNPNNTHVFSRRSGYIIGGR